MKPAIIEHAITQLVAETRDMVTALSEVEAAASKLERLLDDARLTLQVRRAELGRQLNKVRASLPKRGTKENGWGAFLEAVEMDEATAYRYMKLAEATTFHGDGSVKDKPPSYQDLGLDRRENPQPPAAPPPRDEDAPREADDQASDEEVEIDRDTWCTPLRIAEAIGPWDLDPCSNERSHVDAARAFDLELRGEDGLVLAHEIPKAARVFINPPYSDVGPWIEAYAHTRFCFLLKFDPSTKWFARLLELTDVVLVPRGTRVQFEAPAGVPADKSKANPFPHALFFAREADAIAAIRELCFTPWRIR